MLIYYRLPGVIASFALIYYTLVVLALFRLIPVTLTLAGIAGFVLSIGMAVDANILIFERMKEEMRVGKSLPAAVEAGFGRAWNSILDSNVSSLITATILYLFGSSTIRGFALVLILGVLVSMFSAIVVTRSILRAVVAAELVAQGGPLRRQRAGVRRRDRRAAGRASGERLARVFDIIGKKRWFFLISAAGHDPRPDLHPPDAADRRQGGAPVHDRLHRRDDLADPVRRPERHRRRRSRRSSTRTASRRSS